MDVEILSLENEENLKEDKNLLHDTKYLIHFVARAFFIAVIGFFIILGILFIVYCVDIFVNAKNGKTKYPLFNAYIIVSPSMVPTIKINDAVVVKRNDEDYSIGDIITFLSSDINYKGLKITHRIIDKGFGTGNDAFYTTKGDNNSISDPTTVSNDAIYGKVVLKIPKIGYIHSFLSKPSNFFLCILIPTLIVIVYDLIRIAKMMSKKVEII